jgi:DNA-binding CsgD family transcriptional regulator
MLTQDLIKSRKSCFDYQVSLNKKINELVQPLLQVNIDWFLYGRSYLDDKHNCKKVFLLDSNLESAQWMCYNGLNNSVDYTLALRQSPLYQDTFFIPPQNTSDYIVSSLSALGLSRAVNIYNRKDNFIECWDFRSTNDSSILSSNVLNSKTLDVLLRFRKYFDRKLLDLDLQYQVSLEFSNEMDFSFLPKQTVYNNFNVGEFLQPYHDLLQLNGKEFRLSKREWECWRLLAMGQTVKTIANCLNGISPRTVEFYIENLKEKIGCHNKPSLAKLFLEDFKEWV